MSQPHPDPSTGALSFGRSTVSRGEFDGWVTITSSLAPRLPLLEGLLRYFMDFGAKFLTGGKRRVGSSHAPLAWGIISVKCTKPHPTVNAAFTTNQIHPCLSTQAGHQFQSLQYVSRLTSWFRSSLVAVSDGELLEAVQRSLAVPIVYLTESSPNCCARTTKAEVISAKTWSTRYFGHRIG